MKRAVAAGLAEVGGEVEGGTGQRGRPKAWEEDPVSVRRFVTEPAYLGLGDEVYPKIVETLTHIFRKPRKDKPSYQEAVLCWGIGSGKSFLCALALVYMVYRTLCLRDPARYFGLATGSPLHIVSVGPTARVAEKVIYGQIRAMVARSPWFEKYPPDAKMRRELHFPKGLEVLPGNSSELFPLGLNVLGATMDEAAFFVETADGEAAAEDVYYALQRRIQSRFGSKGLILIASSPRHGEDFIMGKLAEADTNETIFASQAAVWDIKPFQGGWCEAGGVTVPKELARQFRANPQKARADYGAEPGGAYAPFFGEEGALEAACPPPALRAEGNGNPPPRLRRDPSPQGRGEADGNGERRRRTANGCQLEAGAPTETATAAALESRAPETATAAGWKPGGPAVRCALPGTALRHPMEGAGRLAAWFRPDDRAERFIHIDLGIRKDACGIAMAKVVGEGTQPVAVVELMHRIVAPQNGEVSLAAVRELVLQIRARGFPIGQVSYDGYQSVDSQQILRRQGLRVATVSVDRDLVAYETLKAMANEGRLRMYRYEPFLKECRQLELVKGQKVDHPKKGSKDVADAVAGAVSEAVKAWSGEGVRGRIV